MNFYKNFVGVKLWTYWNLWNYFLYLLEDWVLRVLCLPMLTVILPWLMAAYLPMTWYYFIAGTSRGSKYWTACPLPCSSTSRYWICIYAFGLIKNSRSGWPAPAKMVFPFWKSWVLAWTQSCPLQILFCPSCSNLPFSLVCDISQWVNRHWQELTTPVG